MQNNSKTGIRDFLYLLLMPLIYFFIYLVDLKSLNSSSDFI